MSETERAAALDAPSSIADKKFSGAAQSSKKVHTKKITVKIVFIALIYAQKRGKMSAFPYPPA